MQCGYFGDLAKEFIITRLDTSQFWSNYLGSTEYGAIITSNAGDMDSIDPGRRPFPALEI